MRGRIALIVGLAGLALAAAAPAQAVTLVTPQGQPVGGKWQRWADQVKVPTVRARAVFSSTHLPCIGGASGCSLGPPPWQIWASDRGALYFELGHVFDWAYLTSTDRRYLARAWSTPRARWSDTYHALIRGAEDGLEVYFAQIYADCARGQNDQNQWLGLNLFEPPGVSIPTIHPTINTCAFIRQVGRRHGST